MISKGTEPDRPVRQKANLCEVPADGGEKTASEEEALERAQRNFAHLFRKLARLYANCDSSSLSQLEAQQLVDSLVYMLQLRAPGTSKQSEKPSSKEAPAQRKPSLETQETRETPSAAPMSARNAMLRLASEDPDLLFSKRVAALEEQVDRILATWREICVLMPPIRNVALRDTLASIGELRRLYDAYFAAHEVPCSIDYQLSVPVDDELQGLDYLEAYLGQLLRETTWISLLDLASSISALEKACPDYRGLHVNLYELLRRQLASSD